MVVLDSSICWILADFVQFPANAFSRRESHVSCNKQQEQARLLLGKVGKPGQLYLVNGTNIICLFD